MLNEFSDSFVKTPAVRCADLADFNNRLVEMETLSDAALLEYCGTARELLPVQLALLARQAGGCLADALRAAQNPLLEPVLHTVSSRVRTRR